MSALSDLIARSATLHDTLAKSDPKLERGQVWCHKCGRTERVNSANCLRRGWPLCCGETMSMKAREAGR